MIGLAVPVDGGFGESLAIPRLARIDRLYWTRRIACWASKGRTMRRRWKVGIGLVMALAASGVAAALATGRRPDVAVRSWIAEARPPIVVGLLHSRSRSLAISEQSLRDAEV